VHTEIASLSLSLISLYSLEVMAERLQCASAPPTLPMSPLERCADITLQFRFSYRSQGVRLCHPLSATQIRFASSGPHSRATSMLLLKKIRGVGQS